jgi:hypothetical protein
MDDKRLLPASQSQLRKYKEARKEVNTDRFMQELRLERISGAFVKRQADSSGYVDYVTIRDGTEGESKEAQAYFDNLSLSEKKQLRERISIQAQERAKDRLTQATLNARAEGEDRLPYEEANRIIRDEIDQAKVDFWKTVSSRLQSERQAVKTKQLKKKQRLTEIKMKAERDTIKTMQDANDEFGWLGNSKIKTPWSTVSLRDLGPSKSRAILQNAKAKIDELRADDPNTDNYVESTAYRAYYEGKAMIGYTARELTSGVTVEGIEFNPRQVDPRITPVFNGPSELIRMKNDDGSVKQEFWERMYHVNHEVFEDAEEAWEAQMELIKDRPYLSEIYNLNEIKPNEVSNNERRTESSGTSE